MFKKLLFSIFILFLNFNSFSKATRLKEILKVKGVRENPLIGYGIVIGLNGTGDGSSSIISSSMKQMFKKLGLNPKKEISSKNIASVIVTTKLPPFARLGQKIDVTVSSIGSASSLAGGTLLVTPLKAGNKNIYALASGQITIGGLESGKRFPTSGKVISGATVEKEVKLNFNTKKSLRLTLNNPDFTTSARIEKTINKELGGKYATARDSTTIDLMIPIHYQRKVVPLLSIVENFTVHTDNKARIIINEKTGTIVAGGNILLKPVAIAHGDISIQVKDGNSDLSKSFHYIKENKTTLRELVESLNALGATPEDLISIFQTLKKNGSLIGEVEFI